MKSGLVWLVSVVVFTNVVKSEPPVQNSGWGAQASGSYSQGYNQQQPSGGYSGGGGGYGAPQPQAAYGAPQVQNSNGGGWGQQQQQSFQGGNGGGGGGGGWGQQQQQSGGNGGGWGQMSQSPMKGGGSMKGGKGEGNGWGPQLNFELDSANLAQNLNPSSIIKSITGIPRRIVTFIRESGLYLLFIPLIIILPLMLLAFNAGRLLGGLGWGWGWHKRSLTSTVESGIIGYLKSPAWQKIAETIMDEHVFESIMKSVEKFNKKDW